jgi:hypothetical protein
MLWNRLGMRYKAVDQVPSASASFRHVQFFSPSSSSS